AALAEAEAARGALEAAHARQAAEAAARVATLERELEHLATARPPVETPVDEARGETDGAPMQVVTVGAGPGAGGRPRPGSGALRVVVLDGDAAWESGGTSGNDVVVLAPGENLAARVTEIAPARVVVNLAARGALGALHTLRASACAARRGGLEAAPHAVLVECADDAAEGFAAVLADPSVAGRAKPLDRVLAELLTRHEPEPAHQRRPRIRAVGLTRK